MTGILIKIFTLFLECPIIGTLLLYILKGNNLIHMLITNADLEESPLYVPLHHFKDIEEKEVESLDSSLSPPEKVAERFITAVDESGKPPIQMGFFIHYNGDDILRQANESTMRYQKGKPISVLDGNLVAIKDEIDCLPYPTTGGTKWLHNERHCTDDACCVKHLRLCGAVLFGKTNMHELGSGTRRINPHYRVLSLNWTVGMVGIPAGTVEDALIT
ncbi:hypothetical protein TanjilG_26712 [Lupinus angustifolius]|uniref:Amidase domain-containing protein n=1 Tax=Lupinus angustifolius TaxID=3871 RepID=A0A394DCH8_LUPAN|nr:hypothetical protein TanjilG_26712 [Lupinus angustifolius]